LSVAGLGLKRVVRIKLLLVEDVIPAVVGYGASKQTTSRKSSEIV
jgi:hypothetical protein